MLKRHGLNIECTRAFDNLHFVEQLFRNEAGEAEARRLIMREEDARFDVLRLRGQQMTCRVALQLVCLMQGQEVLRRVQVLAEEANMRSWLPSHETLERLELQEQEDRRWVPRACHDLLPPPAPLPRCLLISSRTLRGLGHPHYFLDAAVCACRQHAEEQTCNIDQALRFRQCVSHTRTRTHTHQFVLSLAPPPFGGYVRLSGRNPVALGRWC